MHNPYTIWLLCFNVAPLALLWSLFYEDLAPYWSTYVYCIVGSTVVGVGWDYIAIHLHLWYWPVGCCALPRAYGLPLEEPIFMIFTASLIVTTTILCRDILRTHKHHLKRARR